MFFKNHETFSEVTHTAVGGGTPDEAGKEVAPLAAPIVSIGADPTREKL